MSLRDATNKMSKLMYLNFRILLTDTNDDIATKISKANRFSQHAVDIDELTIV